jgi:DNA-directed RNA polymerase specialized sigma24 family protein
MVAPGKGALFLRQSPRARRGRLNILVPHLKPKDILFNPNSEAIALVRSHLATGKRKHLNNRIEPNGALAFGKGEAVEHNWDTYMEIARRFEHKAQYQDREDLRHTIIVRLAEVAERNGDKPFTEWAMLRVASYVVMEYWRQKRRQPQMSLNSQIEDGEGDSIELIDTIADDNAIDLEVWLDAKTWLLGCPKRLIRIANKRVSGIALNGNDQRYLNRYQKQLRLPV